MVVQFPKKNRLQKQIISSDKANRYLLIVFSKIDNIVIGDQFTGLEIFTANGEEGISLVTVEKKKNELVIIHREKRNKIDQLQQIPNKNDFVFLIINNSQIIQKEVHGTDSHDIKTLHKAFPNLKLEDFYYEICKIGIKSIVAVCRKSYVDELLSDFNSKGIILSGISLGVCSISQIIAFTGYDTLNTNSQSLALTNQENIIQPLDDKTRTYEINGLEVQDYYLLGFSAILRWVLKNNSNSGSILQFSDTLWNNQYQQRFFGKGLKAIIYSLLTILLVNFFVFNNYFKAVNNSTTNLEVSKNLTENIKEVQVRVKNKEVQFNNALSGNNSRSSHIINQIISELPTSILLNQLAYHPLEKNIKDEEAIATQDKIIIISGKTINNLAFTNWVELIQKHKEIANVTITQFGKNDTKETVFTLKIKTNETK
jgi:hypothetical protein